MSHPKVWSLWLVVLTALAITACGSVARLESGQKPPPAPGAPSPDPNGPAFVTVVLQPAADPARVAERVVGPGAVAQQAPQRPQENLPQAILRRTYRVSLIRGKEGAALARARADPEVMRAYLGEYPGQYPEP